MTEETFRKDQWLDRYRWLGHRLQSKAEEYATVTSLIDSISPQLTGMPPGGDVTDKTGKIATKLATIQSEIESEQAELLACRAQIKQVIDAVPDESSRTVLQLRYLTLERDGTRMTWEQIADFLHYDRSHVLRLRNKALEQVVLPEGEDDTK